MIINTSRFGVVEIDDGKVIGFPGGLPGFPDLRGMVLISEDDAMEGDFMWMQSVDFPDIAFAIVNVYSIMPDYNPMAEREDLDDLGEVASDNLAIFNIVTIPEDVTKMTVNLRAPIVINHDTSIGKQIILNNEDYHIRHYVFDELKAKIDEKAGGE
jgi:flagellar assembly factor FliW